MIIQKLLALESEAQEAMSAIAKEQTRLAQKAEEEVAQRVAEINKQADITIEQLLAEADASERIDSLQEEYQKKETTLVESFEKHNRVWKERIVHDVLFGK